MVAVPPRMTVPPTTDGINGVTNPRFEGFVKLYLPEDELALRTLLNTPFVAEIADKDRLDDCIVLLVG